MSIYIEENLVNNNEISLNEEDEDNQHFFGQTGTNQDNTPSYSDTTSDNEKTETNVSKNVLNEDMEIMKSLLGNKLLREETTKKNLNEIEICLGQMKVNENKFINFPIINLSLEKFKIEIPDNLLNKGEFFTALIDNKINTMNLIQENYEIENISEFFKNLSNKDHSYDEILQELYDDLNCQKKTKIFLEKIVKSLYSKATSAIADIVRNVKNKKKKSVNESLSLRLNTIMNIHNDIYLNYLAQNQIVNEIKNEENKETYKSRFFEKNGEKIYECVICHKKCISSQALGGHMSKNHPEQSEQYKKKKDIRKKRENERNKLEKIKIELFEKYKMDYIFMKENNEKNEIKRFLKEHYKEYFLIKQKINKEISGFF